MAGRAAVGGIVGLAALALVTAVVLLCYAMRLMLVAEFQTNALGLLEFVRRYNRRARAWLLVDAALCAACLLPPIRSLLLFAELLPLVGYECHLAARGRLRLKPAFAVRELGKIKLEGVAKLALQFACFATCVAKILARGG
jgi:hypothetical protein